MLLSGASRAVARPNAAARGRTVSAPAPLSRRAARLLMRAEDGEGAAAVADEQQDAAAAAEDADAEAAAAAQARAEEFQFNYSDAKKGNAWQPSDVEAALEYYESEAFLRGSSELPYEAEFVTNPLSAFAGGPEDSSWLADVDNNEAYENDDYALAGIPEAAPKIKRGRRDEEDEGDEEALRAAEEEKITAAAFDGVEGLDDGDDDGPEAAWNWRFAGDEEAEFGAGARGGGSGRLDEEAGFLASFSALDLSQHEELSPEAKDLIAVVLDQAVGGADAGLDLVGEALPEDATPVAGLSAAEASAIEALLAQQPGDAAVLDEAAALPDVTGDLAEAEDEAAAAGDPLDAAAVAAYLASLDAVASNAAAGGAGGADDETVAELLAAGAERVAPGAPDVGAAPALPALAAAVGAPDAALESLLAAAPEAEAAGAEAAEAVMGGLAQLEALTADVDEYSELAFPADEDLKEYEAFVDAALDYYASAGADAGAEEDAELLAAARGDEEGINAPVNMYAEMDPELVSGVDALDGEADGGFFDRRGREGQFVERILELGRVTKVVKGGKIMSFRCVAVVGDGKGRVGVGCQAGREVATAVKRALVDAKKNLVTVPLVGTARTIPHRAESWFKAAGVVLQPAADGTGVIAGGAVRSVLELAGVQNVLAKRLGSRSCLNNARVAVQALGELRTMEDYAAARGLPLDYMLS